jgi:hypothetical protein
MSENVKNEITLLLTKQKLFLTASDPHLSEAKPYLDAVFSLQFKKYHIRLPQISFQFLMIAASALLLLFTVKLICKGAVYIIINEAAWTVINLMYVNMIILIFLLCTAVQNNSRAAFMYSLRRICSRDNQCEGRTSI